MKLNDKYKIGYTQGVFDMFHIGHLNLLRQAKELCDYLIVGVNSDKLVKCYKHKTPIINESERAQIIDAIKYVDEVFIADTLDKVEIYKNHPFNAVFIGSDWLGNPRWEQTEKDLKREGGAEVVYLEYTKRISSSGLSLIHDNRVHDRNED